MKFQMKEALKRARENAGYKQREFAAKFKVTLRTVQNWEQGVCEPNMGTLLQLSEFYDCDLDFLIGRIDCKTHDLQFIHDQTGLSEDAIIKIKSLNTEQLAVLNKLIEHTDFKKAISQTAALSDKESINNDYAALIIHHIKSGLGSKKTTPINGNGNIVENSMLFTLSTLMTRILCDITETEL